MNRDLPSLKWRIYKVKDGTNAGLWCAKNYSLLDGFVYERPVFDTHGAALTHVWTCNRQQELAGGAVEEQS